MAFSTFALSRDKAPCGGCPHGMGGCKVRSVCLKWAEWEKRKALRYADSRRARVQQQEELSLLRDSSRRALARRAVGR